MSSLKSQFPFIKHHPDLVYLDSAATTQKPQVVIDAIQHAYGHDYANVHRAAHQLSARATSAFEAVRAQTARFLQLPDARCVVFTKGATESLNMVAIGLSHAYKRVM